MVQVITRTIQLTQKAARLICAVGQTVEPLGFNMPTPTSHILYRTMTNLIHPAVLGSLIVNCIQLVLSGQITDKGLFPILASAVLVWYFILDFWVVMIVFEADPSEYGVGLFALDVLILTLLFASFYFLWIKPADVWLFVTFTLQVVGIIIWNSCLGVSRFNLRNRYDQLLLLCTAVCAAPAVTAMIASPSVHTFAKYSCLAAVACLLIFYTKFTLED